MPPSITRVFRERARRRGYLLGLRVLPAASREMRFAASNGNELNPWRTYRRNQWTIRPRNLRR